MGLQQWFDCYCKQYAGKSTYVESLGWATRSFFEHLMPFAPTSENYFYFAVASLAIPLLAWVNAKSLRMGKREFTCLLIVNPILYCAVGFVCQPCFGDHAWSWSQLAGPSIIGQTAAKPPLVMLPAAVCVQSFVLAKEKFSR